MVAGVTQDKWSPLPPLLGPLHLPRDGHKIPPHQSQLLCHSGRELLIRPKAFLFNRGRLRERELSMKTLKPAAFKPYSP